MVPTVAISAWPTRAGPAIPGLPVAASFTAVTLTVTVFAVVLSTVPSFTLKVKLA